MTRDDDGYQLPTRCSFLGSGRRLTSEIRLFLVSFHVKFIVYGILLYT